MKYIMFKIDRGSIKQFVPVIFPNHLVHVEVANDLMNSSLEGFEIHSAGEYNPIDGVCSGGSSTLNVKIDEDDSRRILMSDYGSLFE